MAEVFLRRNVDSTTPTRAGSRSPGRWNEQYEPLVLSTSVDFSVVSNGSFITTGDLLQPSLATKSSVEDFDLEECESPTRLSTPRLQPVAPRPKRLLDLPVLTLNPRMSSESSHRTLASQDTDATSFALGPLQVREHHADLAPTEADDPASYDLVAPPMSRRTEITLEDRSEMLFSEDHLRVIFSEPSTFLKFTAFLSHCRAGSIPVLIYYLDTLKAIKAIAYANAIANSLDPISGQSFTDSTPQPVACKDLEEKAVKAFTLMVQEDLPAFITQVYIGVVSESISRRITGTLAPSLREASEGLAEVFCLTDPSRPDNPIVFASEEFHRTTHYGVNYAIGRNCRFLQGPKTSKHSTLRMKQACEAGKEHYEVSLNYRRDGSTFMNLLMIAPLCDSRGRLRYFLGAQVDVSGLVKDCTELESLQLLMERKRETAADQNVDESQTKKDEFRDLSEMLNESELETVRRFGGRMHSEPSDDDEESEATGTISTRPRLLLRGSSPGDRGGEDGSIPPTFGGRLTGLYQNYLLVRPAPSLRVLFASPSLRVPGILQSPFLSRIGGSERVRNELAGALTEGRGVTAKIRWVTRFDDEYDGGRSRWIHCTPLTGSNGRVGVWMIIIVDGDGKNPSAPRASGKVAPPIRQHISQNFGEEEEEGSDKRCSEWTQAKRRGIDHTSSGKSSERWLTHLDEQIDRQAPRGGRRNSIDKLRDEYAAYLGRSSDMGSLRSGNGSTFSVAMQ